MGESLSRVVYLSYGLSGILCCRSSVSPSSANSCNRCGTTVRSRLHRYVYRGRLDCGPARAGLWPPLVLGGIQAKKKRFTWNLPQVMHRGLAARGISGRFHVKRFSTSSLYVPPSTPELFNSQTYRVKIFQQFHQIPTSSANIASDTSQPTKRPRPRRSSMMRRG